MGHEFDNGCGCWFKSLFPSGVQLHKKVQDSKKDKCGCGSRFWSFFSPVSKPICETPRGFFKRWRKCKLPALEPGISKQCPFRPMLTFGILWIEFFRRLFIPGASAFVVCAKGTEDEKTKGKNDKKPVKGKDDKAKAKDEEPKCEQLIKAVDLPLYSDYKGKSKEPDNVNENSLLLTTIRCMREELFVFIKQFQVVKQEVSQVYLTGKAHTEQSIEYLRNEDNFYPRIGAITAGALTGYLIALRKGKVKKLFYMGAGAGAVSAVLYPEEAQEYSEEALRVMKKYVKIAYHFLNGDYFAGKPLELEPPKKSKQKYVPNKMQQEYIDIQTNLESESKCEEEEED